MKVAVVYLSRRQEGTLSTLAFLDAYKSKDAGANHDLVIAAKGYQDNSFFVPDAASVVAVPDEGFDIGTYRYVSKRILHDYVVFLNSHARPLVDGWLAKLLAPFEEERVGLVGCTGSHEGISWSFFPNPHVRTNAFAMRRKNFLALDFPEVPTREECLQFEAGHYSLTNRMVGHRVLIAGIEGFKDLADARETNTFRWGNQRGLLVADNHTERYQNASKEERAQFERNSWGVSES